MKTKSIWKKTLLVALLLVAGNTATFAQCDKPVTLKSSVTNYLNSKGEVERSTDEETVVTISKTEVSIAPGGHLMNGKVTSYACNWTQPFKEGKTTVKAELTDGNEAMHATLIVEGKAGKVTLTVTFEEMPGKAIQVVAYKFE